MTQKTARLMHISSQSQEEKQEPENKLKVSKHANESLKYGNFKLQSYQIQQNLLISNNRFQQDYILPQKLKEDKKKNINFLSEQLFELENHTIKKQEKFSSRDEREDSLLQNLNKMNITETALELNPELNPELNIQHKITKDKKNILQIQVQDNSEDEKHTQNVKVDCEEDHEQAKSSQEENVGKDEIKWITYGDQINKTQFARRKLCQNEKIFFKIQREKSGMNFFLPQFDMIINHDLKHALSCKKQIGTKFQYVMSIDNHNFSDKSSYYVGNILGNFTNSVFNIYDQYSQSIVCTTRFKEQVQSSIIAPMCFEVFLLNNNQKYSDLVGVQEKEPTRGLDELYLYPVNKKKISYFRNKKPEYNQSLKAYMLNFNGRVSKGSVKNFILQDTKSGRQILMFGKGEGESFNLYISAPLSPMIGLGIIMPQFASKMLQK